MVCKATFTQYDKDGTMLGGGQLDLPEYLDWMPIAAKAFWFREIGQGNPKTKYVLLNSQGEQLLVIDVALRSLTHVEYKETTNGLENRVQDWIDRQGISRVRRNQ